MVAAAVVGALTGRKTKAQGAAMPDEQPRADRPAELTLRVLRMVGPQARIELLRPGTEFKEG
jgi:hypothetical protein